MRLMLSYSGIDESVAPAELAAFLRPMGQREMYGLLLGERGLADTTQPRYPALSWICDALLPEFGAEIPVALHLCGRLAAMALTEAHALRARLPAGFLGHFVAVQINTDDYPDPAEAARALEILDEAGLATAIIQVHSPAGRRFVEALRAYRPRGLAALLDASRGAGVVPETRPAPIAGVPCGYAGGVRPENAGQEAARILALRTAFSFAEPCWLDLESGLRTRLADGSDVFDLAKAGQVRAYMHAAQTLPGADLSNDSMPLFSKTFEIFRRTP